MTLGQKVVHSDPQIMSGTPVFVGTRVPVYNLFDYLEAGDSLDVFLKIQRHMSVQLSIVPGSRIPIRVDALSPLRGFGDAAIRRPTAHAVGYILSPLRGWQA